MPEPAPWNPDGHAAAARPPLATVRALETVAARCWPPLESEQHGGWVLRAAEGLTRRANSLWPRADPKTPVPQAIAHVEAWYAARGLLPRVTLSPTQQPPDLAARLRAMGWTDADAPTDVLRRPLPWQGARHDGRATITSVPTEDWSAVAGDTSPGQFGAPRLVPPAAFSRRSRHRPDTSSSATIAATLLVAERFSPMGTWASSAWRRALRPGGRDMRAGCWRR